MTTARQNQAASTQQRSRTFARKWQQQQQAASTEQPHPAGPYLSQEVIEEGQTPRQAVIGMQNSAMTTRSG
jgi:hypothetical protein